MKRYLPLLLSALFTGTLAGTIGWIQQMRIAKLRQQGAFPNTSPVAVSTPVSGPEATGDPAALPASRSLTSTLQRIRSRSMLRTGQELVRHYQSCSLAELRAAVESMIRPARMFSLEKAGAFLIAVSALTQRDPESAVQMVSRMQGDFFVPAAIVLLNDWILRDKKAALTWFHGLNDQKHKGQILTAATIFYGVSNPALVDQIRNGVQGDAGAIDEADVQALTTLATADPEAALAKLSVVTDPDRRREIEQRALMFLASKEPAKALSMMALESGPEGQKVQDGQAARTLTLFLSQDRSAAGKWIAKQDPALISRLLAADPALARALGSTADQP